MGLAGLIFFLTGCGSTGSNDNPVPPVAVISLDSTYLVDVGQRYLLNASSSTDGKGNLVGADDAAELAFSWTKIHATSQSAFDSHCEGASVLAEICTKNNDAKCRDNPETACTTNADCDTSDVCDLSTGTTSSECSDGSRCGVGGGDSGEVASFVADAPGPYGLRLLVEARRANDIAVTTLETYPSLYLVGSLFAFGGTLGGSIGELADAADFAPGAVRGEANPATGNLLLADPEFGLVREFALADGAVVGEFGETSIVDAPVALTFDAGGRLFVADASGETLIFDGRSGLRVGTFGDVAAAGESVSAIAFTPSGELLVVDGKIGRGIRVFNSDGMAGGVFGDTATAAVKQAVDAVFFGDVLLIADRLAGDLVRCDDQGESCRPFGTAADVLDPLGPTAVAINPAGTASAAEILIAEDSAGGRVVGCSANESLDCAVFGETAGLTSAYSDIFFAPAVVPTTTTTTTTSTTTLPAGS